MVNPSGRLPMSWPKRIEDNPSFGNFPAENNLIHYAEGHDVGYQYYDRKSTPDPLFPFGFGLSYTSFEISDAQASSGSILGASSTVEISCCVKNTGHRAGKAVVQFHLQMPVTTIGRPRPLNELKSIY
jgi:beta-glucosidase